MTMILMHVALSRFHGKNTIKNLPKGIVGLVCIVLLYKDCIYMIPR